jgi:hypothetical protein
MRVTKGYECNVRLAQLGTLIREVIRSLVKFAGKVTCATIGMV